MRLKLKFPGCLDCCSGVDPNCCQGLNGPTEYPPSRFYADGNSVDRCDQWKLGAATSIDVDITPHVAFFSPFFHLAEVPAAPSLFVVCTTTDEGTTLSAMVGATRHVVAWLGDGAVAPYDVPQSARGLFAKGAVVCGATLYDNNYLFLNDYWLTCEVWAPVDDAFPETAPSGDPAFTFWRFNPLNAPADALAAFDAGALSHGIAQGGILIDETNVPRWARLPAWSDILGLGDVDLRLGCLCFYRPVRIHEADNDKTIAYWQSNGAVYINNLIPDDWIPPLDPPVCGSAYAPFINLYETDLAFGPQTNSPTWSGIAATFEWEMEYPALDVRLLMFGHGNRLARAFIAGHILYSCVDVDYGDGYPEDPCTASAEGPCGGGFGLCLPVGTDPMPVRLRVRVYIDTNEPWPLDPSEVEAIAGQDYSYRCPE